MLLFRSCGTPVFARRALIRAQHKTIKTRVAIKTLLPQISVDTERVQRFFNEAIAVGRIKHSGIAKVFDVGFLACGRAYLTMEYLEGETLTSRIRRAGRLPLGQLAEIARQVANVLDATHQAGITHRDLKPDNVFLVPDAELASGERVKILDFGIAKLSGTTRLTGTSIGTMGTPDYMAPEQWRDSRIVDWRADAYSLGCLAFEMATGRVPFPAASIAVACTKHLTAQPPAIRELAPEMPEELDSMVSRLLCKQPERRPATMNEITRAFAALGAGHAGIRPATIVPVEIARTAATGGGTAIPTLEPNEPTGAPACSRLVASSRVFPALLGSIGVVLLAILVTQVALVEKQEVASRDWPSAQVATPIPSVRVPLAATPPVAASAGVHAELSAAACLAPITVTRPYLAPRRRAIPRLAPLRHEAVATPAPEPLDPYADPSDGSVATATDQSSSRDLDLGRDHGVVHRRARGTDPSRMPVGTTATLEISKDGTRQARQRSPDDRRSTGETRG